MSKAFSLRLKDRPAESLQRVARRMGRTPTESAQILLDEKLRECEFAFIDQPTTKAQRHKDQLQKSHGVLVSWCPGVLVSW